MEVQGPTELETKYEILQEMRIEHVFTAFGVKGTRNI